MTELKAKILTYIITILAVIFLSMNIKLRDERIWQLEVENKDLKEQIYQLEKAKEEK